MNVLKWIWPTLGEGFARVQRNPSYTKKGPGRRHDYITKAEKAERARQERAAMEAAKAMLPV